MKRILIVIAMLATVCTAYAQKSQAAVEKALAAAQKACNDPKKSEKPATWTNLAQKYIDAYTAVQGAGWIGAGKAEISLVESVKPESSTTEKYGENTYDVDTYPNFKYYYLNNVLQMIVVTKPYVEDALENARVAYEKASEVDPTGSKSKEICGGLKKIDEFYTNEAYNSYTLGDLAGASVLFDKAAKALNTEPLAQQDSNAVYNSAFCAFMVGNYEFAKDKFDDCVDMGHYKDGDSFAKLAECYKNLGDSLSYKKTLEDGFVKCPSSQAVIVSLINLYLGDKEDPDKIFKLLDQAKENEPDNASLYNAEGNILKGLGRIEEAIAAYDKCLEIDPKYIYGEIGKGTIFFDKANSIYDEAQREMDNKKYEALCDAYVENLKLSTAPYEKAFEICSDTQIKSSLAAQLKSIYYRLKQVDATLEGKYQEYSNYLDQAK